MPDDLNLVTAIQRVMGPQQPGCRHEDDDRDDDDGPEPLPGGGWISGPC